MLDVPFFSFAPALQNLRMQLELNVFQANSHRFSKHKSHGVHQLSDLRGNLTDYGFPRSQTTCGVDVSTLHLNCSSF